MQPIQRPSQSKILSLSESLTERYRPQEMLTKITGHILSSLTLPIEERHDFLKQNVVVLIRNYLAINERYESDLSETDYKTKQNELLEEGLNLFVTNTTASVAFGGCWLEAFGCGILVSDYPHELHPEIRLYHQLGYREPMVERKVLNEFVQSITERNSVTAQSLLREGFTQDSHINAPEQEVSPPQAAMIQNDFFQNIFHALKNVMESFQKQATVAESVQATAAVGASEKTRDGAKAVPGDRMLADAGLSSEEDGEDSAYVLPGPLSINDGQSEQNEKSMFDRIFNR